MDAQAPSTQTEEAVQRVLALVREQNLSPDDRLPSERRLGQQLQLGRTPLNKAVACLIAQGHLRRIGYKLYPTGYLSDAERSSTRIAVPPIHVLHMPYRSGGLSSISFSLHEAAHDVAEGMGSHTIPIIAHDAAEQCRQLEGLLRQGTNGFVLWPQPHAPLGGLLRQCRDRSVPFVLCDIDLGPFDFVGVDNEQGTRLAVEHLHGLGHRKIAYITQSLQIPSLRRRCDGYVQACRSLGLRRAAGAILEVPGFHPDQAAELFDRIRREFSSATALVFSNDMGAVYFLPIAREAGIRVPEELSVIGFDDVDVAGVVTPQLTTIAQDFYHSGVIATQLLYHLIREKQKGRRSTPYRARVEPRLIIRQSTAGTRG